MRALLVFALVAALAAVVAGREEATAHPRAAASFPCRWRWDLQAGLRAGYVTAGNSAECGGRSGSLTLTARLLSWNPKTRTWRVDKTQTRTWKDLSGNRYLALSERCRVETVRAVFEWILRDSSGALVSRKSLRTGTLKVPGPDCRFQIG